MLNMAVRQSTGLCSQNSVVWYILLSISFTSRELMATVCSDAVLKYNDSVLRMCESGNAVGKQIVVDTFDSALYGVGNCECDINFITNMTTVNLYSWIVKDLLPGAPCLSGVFLDDSVVYVCDYRKNFSKQLDINLSSRIRWRHGVNTTKSGYCMQFESNSTDVSLNVTCIQTDRPLITTSTLSPTTSTTSTSTLSSELNQNTTIQHRTTETSTATSTLSGELNQNTTIQHETKKTSTIPNDITTSSTIATKDGITITATQHQPTTGSAGISTKSEEKGILMTIIVPAAAAGAGFILLLTVIVLIVMCKRKKKAAPNEEKEDSKSGVRANVLYISADEVADIKQQDGLTNNSFLTDQESKHDTLQNSEEQNEMELSNIDQPQGALYAVVNKKNKSESVKEGAPIAAPRKNNQDISGADSLRNPKSQNEMKFHNTEQSQGTLYAVVNRKNKSESVKEGAPIAAPRKNNPDISGPDSLRNPKSQNEMKFQDTEQSQGTLYAVVNRKNKSGSFKEKTPRTMPYKNQDGLSYTQVEVNADSGPTSGAPSVRISSKETEGDRVTYSEVKIEDLSH